MISVAHLFMLPFAWWCAQLEMEHKPFNSVAFSMKTINSRFLDSEDVDPGNNNNCLCLNIAPCEAIEARINAADERVAHIGASPVLTRQNLIRMNVASPGRYMPLNIINPKPNPAFDSRFWSSGRADVFNISSHDKVAVGPYLDAAGPNLEERSIAGPVVHYRVGSRFRASPTEKQGDERQNASNNGSDEAVFGIFRSLYRSISRSPLGTKVGIVIIASVAAGLLIVRGTGGLLKRGYDLLCGIGYTFLGIAIIAGSIWLGGS